MNAESTLLTDGEAADLLRMLRTRLVRLAKQGRVPHVLLPDGELRFDRADLLVWIQEHKYGTEVSK